MDRSLGTTASEQLDAARSFAEVTRQASMLTPMMPTSSAMRRLPPQHARPPHGWGRGYARKLAWSAAGIACCAPAHAHGITGGAVLLLAAAWVGLPCTLAGLTLWGLAAMAQDPGTKPARTRPWLAPLRAFGMFLAALGAALTVLLASAGGWDVYQRGAPERSQARIDETSAALAKRERATVAKATQAQAERWQQCTLDAPFVGTWSVSRPRSYYTLHLHAGGRFELAMVIDNDAGLQLARDGAWHFDGQQMVWTIKGRELRQHLIDRWPQGFRLRDAKGQEVLYSRDSPLPPASCIEPVDPQR